MIIFILASFIFIVITVLYLLVFIAIIYRIKEYVPPESRINRLVIAAFVLISLVFWASSLFSLLEIPH